MSNDKAKPKITRPQSPPQPGVPPLPTDERLPEEKGAPLYRRIDWVTFFITFLVTMVGYLYTVAPDLTLEDSGELAVGSYYAGVPHPPGYPVWTIYTWLFTVLVPISNIAFRVALSSAFAAALACGFIGLMVSRGSSMILESIELFKNLDRKKENAICLVSGFVAGALMGFNGFMWSQAVIVEVYTLSVLSLVGVMACLLRWIYAPEQRRYLYFAFFLFGICFTNHQTLVVAAMGIEILIIAARPAIGRDLLMGNSAAFIVGMILNGNKMIETFENPPVFALFKVIGILSLGGFVALTILTRKTVLDWLKLGRDILLTFSLAYLAAMVVLTSGFINPDGRPLGLLHAFGLLSMGGTIWLATLCRRTGPQRPPLLQYILLAVAGAYVLALMIASRSPMESLTAFWLIHSIGLLSIAALIWIWWRQHLLGSEIWVVGGCGLAWILGAAFYLYMPIASMTNPPMNWGYPRVVEGFVHALTRGQYEKANPTTSIPKFVEQVGYYFIGAEEEFNLIYLLIALIPFFFLGLMRKRERAWLIGLGGIYICLAFLLLYLLNPEADLQSLSLNRVFFTASHVMIAMCIGYGLTLIAAAVIFLYEESRWMITGAAGVSLALAFYSYRITTHETEYVVTHYAAMFGIALAAAFFLCTLLLKRHHLLLALLSLFSFMPLYSVLTHWSDNEQRHHLFGYWFGHDMFHPPFDLYPPMARDAVLFGGTDPGRFNPTYMIFCESMIPPSKKRDPKFDRRDVYIITQNALADGTYLSYIRAHYNRSRQEDPPFFQEALRPTDERVRNYTTNLLARTMMPVDRYFLDLGKRIEDKRRADKIYPPKEILTPTYQDSENAFKIYIEDYYRRRAINQLEQGEMVDQVGDKHQVSGQVSVMAINGLLTETIFKQNPGHEFYVEESMPLKWMYEHLEPYGIILKINREKLPEMSQEIVDRDHKFWTEYSKRLIGDWITYETSVQELCTYAEKVYLNKNLKAFLEKKGEPKFMRDDNAQKAFSKLRSAIAGLYFWRWETDTQKTNQVNLVERARMQREAEFAFKQAFAFCPYSPEAVSRYAEFLLKNNRVDDAIRVANTCLKIDPNSRHVQGLLEQLLYFKQRGMVPPPGASNVVGEVLKAVAKNLQEQDAAGALNTLQKFFSSPDASVENVLEMANQMAALQSPTLLEACLLKLVQLVPQSPEAWYDLARVNARLGRSTEAISNLNRSMTLNDERLKANRNAHNLRSSLKEEADFKPLTALPEFKKLAK